MINALMHRKVRAALYDLAIGENRDPGLLQHAAGCDQCRRKLDDMRAALGKLDALQYDPASDRPEAYWQMFGERVERRLAAPDNMSSTIPALTWFGSRPAFLAGVATALGAVVITLGVWWWSSRTEAPLRDHTTSPAGIANVRERTYDYLDRSKVVLLGVLHSDEEDLDLAPDLLGRNREASRKLVEEARLLTSDLSDPKDQRLRQLVTDLEVILMELANLDTASDVPGLEIIRESVKRKGVLLKITIEEMNKVPEVPQASTADDRGTTSEVRSL